MSKPKVYSDLEDKVIVITGSTAGIGATAAVSFAQFGARVVVHGRDLVRAKEVASRCNAASPNGHEALAVLADLCADGGPEKLIKATVDRFGRIDALINNAGIMSSGVLADDDIFEKYDAMMDLGVRARVALAHAALPYLEQSKGVIVNSSSTTSMAPEASYLNYCMQCACADNMVKTLALELGPKGIRVNGLNCHEVETLMLEKAGLTPDEAKSCYVSTARRTPLRRIGQPEDVANVMLFLCSNEASFVNGTNILVDGGVLNTVEI